MDEGAEVCQVEDEFTSAPRNLLNETEGVQTDRWGQIVKADKCNQ